VNLSVRHDDYAIFSFDGKHPLGLLPQSTTDGRLIPHYENNIEARTKSLNSIFEPKTFCSTQKHDILEKTTTKSQSKPCFLLNYHTNE
jgi:hypothetical protein